VLLFSKVSPFTNGKPLLPQLRSLIAHGYWLHEDYGTSVLTCLLSPTLRELELSFTAKNPEPHQLRTIAKIIQEKTPHLTQLVIRLLPTSNGESNNLTVAFTNLISCLPLLVNLQTVLLPENCISSVSLAHLSRLKALQKLYLREEDGNWSQFGLDTSGLLIPRHDKSIRVFPSLTTLYLTVRDKSIESAFEDVSLQDSRIQTLSILYSCDPTSRLASLLSKAAPDLEVLHLASPFYKDNGIGLHILMPFADCHNLISCDILGHILTDTELEDLLNTCSWPRLNKLALVGRSANRVSLMDFMQEESEMACSDIPGLTLWCLNGIAVTFPNLRALVISVMASRPRDLTGPTTTFKGLKTLRFVSSFFNFKYPEFDRRAGLRYLSTILEPGVRFTIGEDVDDPFDEIDGGSGSYIAEYRSFCILFARAVLDYLDAKDGGGRRISAVEGES
jgi:hypothetical protein